MEDDFNLDVEPFECNVNCIVRKEKEKLEREKNVLVDNHQKLTDELSKIREQMEKDIPKTERNELVERLNKATKVKTLNALVDDYRKQIKDLKDFANKDRIKIKDITAEMDSIRNQWELDEDIQKKIKFERKLNNVIKVFKTKKTILEKKYNKLLKMHENTVKDEEKVRRGYNKIRGEILNLNNSKHKLELEVGEMEKINEKLSKKVSKKEQVKKFRDKLIEKFKNGGKNKNGK